MSERILLPIPSSPPAAALPEASFPSQLLNKKRVHVPDSDYEPSSDIDPPIFSSDDWPPREYLARTKNKKRVVPSHFFDAGLAIWEDEEWTDLSSSMTVCGPSSEGMTKEGDVTTAEEHANKIIEKAIEDGFEEVDLSYLSLQQLPSELQALSSLISQPHFPTTNPRNLPSSYFTPLTPSVHLFLGNNNLTTLSSPVFALSNLTFLSIRNNQLTEIPEWISRLKNLKRLNFGWNKIVSLPYSLLDLEELGSGMDEGIGWWPNPLLERTVVSVYARNINDDSTSTSDDEGEKICPSGSTVIEAPSSTSQFHSQPQLKPSPMHCRTLITSKYVTKRFVASSPITFFNLLQQPVTSAPTARPYVSSLIESCLRTISCSPLYRGLNDSDDDIIPPHLLKFVNHAVEYSNEWRKECTVCRQGYVIKAAEWVEWWKFSPTETEEEATNSSPNPANPAVIFAESETVAVKGNIYTLPMVRRVCSWGCAREWEDELLSAVDAGDLSLK